MKSTPAYILRNCTIFADRDSKLGQASEITIPPLAVKTEEFRNAGMHFPLGVRLGYEAMELTFALTAFDPATIKLFGLKPGTEREFYATGALIDDDGTTSMASVYVRGHMTGLDAGAWSPGEKATNSFTVSVRYLKLEVAGEQLIEMDPFEVKIGGVSQTGDIRAALGL